MTVKSKFFVALAIMAMGVSVSSCSDDESESQANKINGHEYVDLGLPSGLKWATCNVGATNPDEFGNHYCWGITTPVDDEGICDSPYGDEELDSMDDIAGTNRDIAHIEWGASWRMPSKEEMSELLDNCTWEYYVSNGNVMSKVTGPNGNSIYFVAAGTRYDNKKQEWYGPGEDGYYWTSNRMLGMRGNAWGLHFTENGKGINGWNLPNGFAVRPVSD